MDADHAFLSTLLQNLALQPEKISIQRGDDDRGVLFRIKPSKLDMPRLIGKQGQNINALRLIMKLYAKNGPRISLVLEEPN